MQNLSFLRFTVISFLSKVRGIKSHAWEGGAKGDEMSLPPPPPTLLSSRKAMLGLVVGMSRRPTDYSQNSPIYFNLGIRGYSIKRRTLTQDSDVKPVFA